MKIVIADDYQGMSRLAADAIEACVAAKPDCVLGLATGTTPIGLYNLLAQDCAEGKVSFADVTTYNLDEYCGLAPEHPQSYRYFMNEQLFDRVNIDKARTHVIEACAEDADAVCAAYEAAIEAAGGIDLQLLGLGHNGHIGFNEPNDAFDKATHKVELTQSTIEANSRLFDSIDEVPRAALTMGIGTIMAARSIVLVANGAGKAQIVHDALFGPVTPQVPASILQFHPNVMVFVDAEAGSLIADKLA